MGEKKRTEGYRKVEFGGVIFHTPSLMNFRNVPRFFSQCTSTLFTHPAGTVKKKLMDLGFFLHHSRVGNKKIAGGKQKNSCPGFFAFSPNPTQKSKRWRAPSFSLPRKSTSYFRQNVKRDYLLVKKTIFL